MSLKAISQKSIVDGFDQLQSKGTLCDTILELSDGSIYLHSVLLLATFPSFQPYLIKQSLPIITSVDRPVKFFLLELFQLNLEDGRKFINTIYARTSNLNDVCVINFAKQCLETGDYDTKNIGNISPVTPNDIMSGLSELQQKGTLCDTIINFSNGSIYVHSVVLLTASLEFKNHFQMHKSVDVSMNIDRPTKRFYLEILGLGLEEGRKFVNCIYGKSTDLNIINKVLRSIDPSEVANDENNISTTIEYENVADDGSEEDFKLESVKSYTSQPDEEEEEEEMQEEYEMKDEDAEEMQSYEDGEEGMEYYAIEEGDGDEAHLVAIQQIKEEREDDLHERSYECHVCGMRFGRLIPFRRHFARHESLALDLPNEDEESELNNILQETPLAQDNDYENVLIKQEVKDSVLEEEEEEDEFICIHCSKKCYTKARLKAHMRLHTGGKHFRCTVCLLVFSDRYPLDRHMITQHPDVRAYRCIQCNETFQMKRMLKEHAFTIHGNAPLKEERTYVCEVCSKIFKAKYLLVQHQIKHSKDTPFECDLCEMAFKKKSRLSRHYNEMHRDVARPFCCSHCGDTFHTNTSLSNHIGQKHKRFGDYVPKTPLRPISKKMRIKMEKGMKDREDAMDEIQSEEVTVKVKSDEPKKPRQPKVEIKKEKLVHNCLKCCRTFTNHSALNNHMRGHNDSVSHMCQICGNTYRSLYGVRQHLKVQHQLEVFVDGKPLEKPKKVFCEKCGKGFSKQSKLLSHELLHNDNNPFKCDKCECAYRSKANLLKHQSVKHSVLRPYECNICRKTFAINTYLWEHMKIHLSVKPYVCELCGKRFGKKSILQIHERCIHSGVCPYVCQVCDKRFKTTSSLWKHVQTHNERRNYPCSMCEKSFTDTVGLRRHMRNHTGDRPFACDKCGKSFTLKSSLMTHIKFHSGIRTYNCAYCAKSFVVPAHLKRHQLIHARRGEITSFKSSGGQEIRPGRPRENKVMPVGRRDEKTRLMLKTFDGQKFELEHLEEEEEGAEEEEALAAQQIKGEYDEGEFVVMEEVVSSSADYDIKVMPNGGVIFI